MAYCPECGAEFGAGIRRCPECRVDLMDELEEPNLYDSQEENLVLATETASSQETQEIKALLEGHGILCVLESLNKQVQRASSSIRILVNEKDQERSQQLLQQGSK